MGPAAGGAADARGSILHRAGPEIAPATFGAVRRAAGECIVTGEAARRAVLFVLVGAPGRRTAARSGALRAKLRAAVAGDIASLSRTNAVHGRATGRAVVAVAPAGGAIPAPRRGAAESLLQATRALCRGRRSRRRLCWCGEGREEGLVGGAQGSRHGLRRVRRLDRWRHHEEAESCQGQGEPKNHLLHTISFLNEARGKPPPRA